MKASREGDPPIFWICPLLPCRVSTAWEPWQLYWLQQSTGGGAGGSADVDVDRRMQERSSVAMDGQHKGQQKNIDRI